MKRKLRVLDLFSGIGGFSLGLEMTGGFETVCFVELDPFCRAVLRKNWPRVRQFQDVRSVTAARLGHAGVGDIDVICGGFPCQPYSVAGQRKGHEDDRHLWPEMRRVIASVEPAWVIGENVTGIVPMALDSVLADLEAIGYATQSFVIPAVAVDARHRRDRVWIVGGRGGVRHEGWSAANAHRRQLREQSGRCNGAHRESPAEFAVHGSARTMADAAQQSKREPADETHSIADGWSSRDESGNGGTSGEHAAFNSDAANAHCASSRWTAESRPQRCEWSPEPGVGRVVAGIPGRAYRLKCLGNAVVPQLVAEIGYAILAASEQRA